MSEMFRFAVIGQNITYSKSPDIFAAIFGLADVTGDCSIHSVSPSELKGEVALLQSKGFQGISITIPYKKAIIPLLTSIDPAATAIGSVNSVKLTGASAEGHNTDWFGFVYAIKSSRRLSASARALVIGTGGSAAAVIYALSKSFGMKKISIFGRSDDSVKLMKSHFEPLLGISLERAVGAGGRLPKVEFDLIVNCTPIGGWNLEGLNPIPAFVKLSKSGVYIDLNYNEGNRTVQRLKDEGLTAIDGSTMLVAQAVRSFEIWTGITVSFDPVYSAVFGPKRHGKT